MKSQFAIISSNKKDYCVHSEILQTAYEFIWNMCEHM